MFEWDITFYLPTCFDIAWDTKLLTFTYTFHYQVFNQQRQFEVCYMSYLITKKMCLAPRVRVSFHLTPPAPPLWIRPLQRIKQCDNKAVPSCTIIRLPEQCKNMEAPVCASGGQASFQVAFTNSFFCWWYSWIEVPANSSTFLYQLLSFFVIKWNIFSDKCSKEKEPQVWHQCMEFMYVVKMYDWLDNIRF